MIIELEILLANLFSFSVSDNLNSFISCRRLVKRSVANMTSTPTRTFLFFFWPIQPPNHPSGTSCRFLFIYLHLSFSLFWFPGAPSIIQAPTHPQFEQPPVSSRQPLKGEKDSFQHDDSIVGICQSSLSLSLSAVNKILKNSFAFHIDTHVRLIDGWLGGQRGVDADIMKWI